MSGDTPRPVWITHADVSLVHTGDKDALARLADGFNRAPADPVEAVAVAMRKRFGFENYCSHERDIPTYLAALGYPGLAPDTKEDTT